MKIQKIILGLVFAIFALTASAQTATPLVKDRQVNQQKRIVEGVKKGEVNKKEFARLERQQRNVNRSKRRAKSDGKVSKREKARLHAKQNKASRNIKRAKNN